MNNERDGRVGRCLSPVPLALGLAVLGPWPLALSPAVGGDFSSSARGTAGANFLKLGTGARAMAMGGAAAAVTEDPTAMYWNPACLGSSRRPAAALTYASYVEQISYTDLSLAYPLASARGGFAHRHELAGTLGFDATLLDFGSIDGYDASGAPASSYHPRASVMALGYAWSESTDAGTFWLGAAGKYVDSRIADKAAAFAVDLGILHRPADRLTLGAAAQNLGQGLKFDRREDPLPFTVRVGAGYDLAADWLAALDLVQARDNAVTVALGVEYALRLDENGRLLFRGGYNTAVSDVSGLAGPSFGFGYSRGGLGLDYAFVPVGDLGATHRAGVTWTWGRGATARAAPAPSQPAPAPVPGELTE